MSKNTGVKSRKDGNEAIQAAWELADKLNVENPPRDGATWIPVESIEIRDDILPRMGLVMSRAQEYAEIVDRLPPAKVQKDTHVLIAGRHRVEATWMSKNTCIRVFLIDVDNDDDMKDMAYQDNVTHGQPMTFGEKAKAALAKYLRSGKTMTAKDIAEWAGIGYDAARRILNEAGRGDTYIDRRGVEKSTQVRTVSGRPIMPGIDTRSRQPVGRDTEYDDLAGEARSPIQRPPVLSVFDEVISLLSNEPSVMVISVPPQFLDAIDERFDDVKTMALKWIEDGKRAVESRRKMLAESVPEGVELEEPIFD